MSTRAVLREIGTERERQIDAEGFNAEHDANHADGELSCAAACYAIGGADSVWRSIVDRLWPWSENQWNPKGRRRNLIRAAALLVAEIERFDRAERAEVKR